MTVNLTVHFDGKDEERLQRVLRGEVFSGVLAELMKHLFWWYHEANDEQAKAYRLAFEFVKSNLAEAGVQVEWEVFGTVRTRDGRILEKTEADDPWTRAEVSMPAPAPSAPADSEPSTQSAPPG